MTIEFTNAIEPRSHASISVAIVVAACAFFFIPTTLIVLGYYSSQPTGTLVSPLPQGVLSELQNPVPNIKQETPKVAAITPVITPTPTQTTEDPESNAPIIAAPNESTKSADTSVTPSSANNIIDHTASVSAGLSEEVIQNSDIKESSQIYLSPRLGDKTIYSVKSKTDGSFTLTVDPVSDTLRYVDYHIVNP